MSSDVCLVRDILKQPETGLMHVHDEKIGGGPTLAFSVYCLIKFNTIFEPEAAWTTINISIIKHGIYWYN